MQTALEMTMLLAIKLHWKWPIVALMQTALVCCFALEMAH